MKHFPLDSITASADDVENDRNEEDEEQTGYKQSYSRRSCGLVLRNTDAGCLLSIAVSS